MFAAAAKGTVGSADEPERKWWEDSEGTADFLLDLTAIALPPRYATAIKTGQALGHIVDRERRKRILSDAQNNLGGAIADNWNAGVYLSQKLPRIRSYITETQRTITLCNSRRKPNSRVLQEHKDLFEFKTGRSFSIDAGQMVTLNVRWHN
jgi:hypothetical protein